MKIKILKNLLKFLFDLLFPIKCLGCGQEGKWLCTACLEKLHSFPTPAVSFNQPPFSRLIFAFHYHHPLVRKLISVYKYNFVPEISKILNCFLFKRISGMINDVKKKNFILIPIPLHSKKLRWRGFNQAELLASGLQAKLDLEWKNDILIRQKNTPPQVNLQGEERCQNVREAFRVSGDPELKNRIVILVDDVWTTGSTLKEAARAILRKNRPREIWGLVVAKG